MELAHTMDNDFWFLSAFCLWNTLMHAMISSMQALVQLEVCTSAQVCFNAILDDEA